MQAQNGWNFNQLKTVQAEYLEGNCAGEFYDEENLI